MIEAFKGTYGFLSNFDTTPFGEWRSMEHYFQFHKAADPTSVRAQKIFWATTPGQAKYHGRIVELRPDWEEVKLQVMRDGLELKFAVGTKMADRLLATSPHALVEGNFWGDTYWGVSRGVGKNWLGLLLMARRAELSEVAA